MNYSLAIVAGSVFGAFIGLDAPSVVWTGLVTAALLVGRPYLLGVVSARGQPGSTARVQTLVTMTTVALLAAIVGSFTGALPATLGEPGGSARLEGTVVRTHCQTPAGLDLSEDRLRTLERLGMRCGLLLEDATIDGVETPGLVPLNGWREDFSGFDLGDRIACSARLTATATQPNPGVGWPARQPWLRFRGFATDLESPRLVARGTSWDRARRMLGQGLEGPADVVGLYRAMLLGDRTGLPVVLRDAFVDTGTAHLLAISGLHLAVLAGALFRLLVVFFMLRSRAIQVGRPRVPAAALTIGIVWCYTALVGQHSQATQRAAIFITVFLGALVLARRPSPGRSLWVALAGLTLLDPRALLTPGFQLSFAAAGGLVAGAPHLRRLDAWLASPGRFPEWYWARPMRILAALVGTTVICHFATAPLALAWFGQASWAGLWVNLAAVPLASLLVVPLGALWMVCAAISPALGSVVAPLAIAPAQWLMDAITTWGEIWGSTQGAAMPHWAGVFWALAIVVGLLATARRTGARMGVLAGVLAVAALGVTAAASPSSDEEALRVTLLDVGHGDATVIRAPGGKTMVLDTGGAFDRGSRHASNGRPKPSANTSLANWKVLPALSRLGVDTIDVLAITHAHLDHIGAALRLVDRVQVRELWLSPCGRNRSVVKQLAKRVRKRGGRVRIVTAGQHHTLGELDVVVLWPDVPSIADDRGRCLVGLNDGSLVFRLDYAGRRLLMTGDIEEESEEILVEIDAQALRSDVLKVPHHGSRSSSTPAFLDAVRPTWALVPGVLHGHRSPMPPHVSVLSEYRRRNAHLRITGRDGAIHVRVGPDGALDVRTAAPARASP